MAFLDNSGDIILDAVLTDTGRYRLAKGDGSFKITKFALGDDEIDYSLYNSNHPSGSAYYDLDILQTPVLEASTDNASALKSYLLTVGQTDLLFLPVIKLFENGPQAGSLSYDNKHYFLIASDFETQSEFSNVPGVFFTATPSSTSGHAITLHQGWDTPKVSPTVALSADLVETTYIVEMDNRLGSLIRIEGNSVVELNRSYIDDDQMATYILTTQRNVAEVSNIPVSTATNPVDSSVLGPRGTSLKLRVAASKDLETRTYLFEQLGNDGLMIESVEYYMIDSNIRITGANTGYRIDVPVRYIKKK
jgi:hypothetical protein